MRLATFDSGTGWTAGVLCGDRVVPAGALARAAGWPEERLDEARTVRGLLALGTDAMAELGGLAEAAPEDAHALAGVRLGPPVPDPRKIVCAGLNYVDHAREVGAPIPEVPLFFAKYDNALIGFEDDIVPPVDTAEVDYEAELAVVIGQRGRYIAEDRALEHIAGAMVFNDVSARDLQLATQTWTGGKAVDTFGPCGPALVTLDEIGDLQALSVQTRVDGRLVQDGNTADMIFSAAYLVAFLSRIMTLEPGDIIATGTPAGVGKSLDPPLFLSAGMVVEVAIEKLGATRNRIAAPQGPAA